MFAAILLAAVTLAQAPAQPAVSALEPLGTGPCLDSTRPVPRVLQPPVVRTSQVVRIDRVLSTATMMPGQTIGFLYTLQDGSTWLGQREQAYMSAAAADQMNRVLSSTHLPGENVSHFPPEMKHGVATKYTEFFKVQIVPSALPTLQIELQPCVVWPAGRPLPDPQM